MGKEYTYLHLRASRAKFEKFRSGARLCDMDNLTLPHWCNFEIRAIFIDIDFEIRVIKYYLCTC